MSTRIEVFRPMSFGSSLKYKARSYCRDGATSWLRLYGSCELRFSAFIWNHTTSLAQLQPPFPVLTNKYAGLMWVQFSCSLSAEIGAEIEAGFEAHNWATVRWELLCFGTFLCRPPPFPGSPWVGATHTKKKKEKENRIQFGRRGVRVHLSAW